MHLGAALAVRGHPARFEPRAEVRSDLPADPVAAAAQRRRWEHGHLHTLVTQVPRLVVAALRQRRLGPLALAAELSVPPLSALVLAWLVALTAAAGWWWAGGVPGPTALLIGGAAVGGAAGMVAWSGFARELLALPVLLAG